MSTHATRVVSAAEEYGTDRCMFGAETGARCENAPTHRSKGGDCVWCEKHAHPKWDRPLPAPKPAVTP